MEYSTFISRLNGGLKSLDQFTGVFVIIFIVSIYRIFAGIGNEFFYYKLSAYLILLLIALNLLRHYSKQKINTDLNIKPNIFIYLFIAAFFNSTIFFMAYAGIYKGFWLLIRPAFYSEYDFSFNHVLYRAFLTYVCLYFLYYRFIKVEPLYEILSMNEGETMKYIELKKE